MTDFSLINAALTRTGNSPITSLSDGTAESEIAAANYDELVRALLGRHPWRFATRTETLNLLAEVPPPPWSKAYQLPNDVLLLRDVRADQIPVRWRQMGDTVQVIFEPPIDALVVTYQAALPEVEWPPYFRHLAIASMEAVFLRGIGERYQEAEARQREADRHFGAATRLDSQAARVGSPIDSPLLRRRRTSLGDRWPRGVD